MDQADPCVQQLFDQMQATIAAGDLASARRLWELVRDNEDLRFANKNAVLSVCCDALGLDVVQERRLCAEALRRSLAQGLQEPVVVDEKDVGKEPIPAGAAVELTGGGGVVMGNDAFKYDGAHGWNNWQTERVGWCFAELVKDETGVTQGTLFFEKDGHGNKLLDQKNPMSDFMFNGWRRLFVRNMDEEQKQAFIAKCTTFKYQGFLLVCTN